MVTQWFIDKLVNAPANLKPTHIIFTSQLPVVRSGHVRTLFDSQGIQIWGPRTWILHGSAH